MLEQAKDNLIRYVSGKRAAAFVSGGGDSMCLLHLCAETVPHGFFVVTVDHGIRPEAADEVRFVRDECARLGVGCLAYKADVPALAQAAGDSLETAGRKYRRELMRALIDGGQADVILTAHHADDNAETVLMHALRGAGTRGLAGMQVRDGYVVRPLIGTRRAEIAAYNAARSVKFVTDPSNADSRYTRNFIRNEVMPLLNSRFDATGALNRLAAAAAADEAYLKAQLNADCIRAEDGGILLTDGAFSTDALAPRYVFEAMRRLGADDCDRNAAARAIDLYRGRTGRRAPMTCGIEAARDPGGVALYRPAPAEYRETPFTGPGLYPAFGLEVRPCPPVPEKGRLRFDPNAVPDGAVLRYRREGDIFRPFGSGRKKLKEYLIDKKIPVRIRDKLPLLCYNEEVLAVCGVEISDRVRLSGGTAAAEIVFTGEKPWKS